MAFPPFNPTPDLSSKYGAPMGRMSHASYTDNQGTFAPMVTYDARPFRLLRSPLNRGGYDRDGPY